MALKCLTFAMILLNYFYLVKTRIAPFFTMDYDVLMIDNILPQISMNRRALLIGSSSLWLMPFATRAATPSIEHITMPRVLGKADAPIKVVELFSMTCSHCANFHNYTFPDVKKRLIDTGMIQFEMRPFPLDQIALRAHALARALPKNKYFPMVSMLLKDVDIWARSSDPLVALSRMARLAGMSSVEFEANISNQSFLEALVAMRQDAHKTWEIQSTPSFVVNNKTILSGDLSYEDFASKINVTDT